MKTIEDLRALYPVLVDLVIHNDHEIGESYPELSEDGWGTCNDAIENYVCYEKDGWCIDIVYKCCGNWDDDPGDYWNAPSRTLLNAYGEITEICASHYDPDTDEMTYFSDNELRELRDILDKELEDIA